MKRTGTLFGLSIMLAVFFVLAGYYTYTQVLGGTTIGKTITTNSDLENGLVGHWTFDGEDMAWSSTTAEVRDRSGNNIHGNVTNFDSNSVVTGKLGQALDFDGTDDGISYGSSMTYPNTGPTTFSAWIKPESIGPIIARGGSSGIHTYIILDLTGTNQLRFSKHTSATAISRISSLGTISLNEWQHVVGTWDGTIGQSGAVHLYINGQETTYASEGVGSGSISNASARTLYVGRTEATPTYFNGSIDDARVYNRVLSADEVSRLYELGATTHIAKTVTTNSDLENGLVGHWTFDGEDMAWSSTTAEVRDRSGQNKHGNIVSFGQEAAVPGKIGQALSLDGVDDIVSISSAPVSSYPLTLAAWVNIKSYPGSGRAIVFTDNLSSASNYYCGAQLTFNASTFSVQQGDCTGTGAGDRRTILGTTVYSFGRWYHLVGVFNGHNDMEMYVNGVRETVTPSGTATESLFASAPMSIGNWDSDLDRFSDMNIDDVRVYNRALSADEVSRLYELGATTHIAKTVTTNSDLENGLVGHWTFDGEDMAWSSTTAEVRDRSGNNIHGNVTNFDSNSVVTGKLGQALHFEGDTDLTSITLNSSMMLTSLVNNAQTIALWAFPTATSTNSSAGNVMFGYTASGERYTLTQSPGSVQDSVQLAFHDGATGIATESENGTLPLNTWTHVTVTITNADIAQIYINGLPSGSSLDTSVKVLNTTSPNFRIGFRQGANSLLYWEGNMDDVRVYNRALSADEVSRLYELGK